jgi:tRNA (guanine37-N1)-methyltransferase
MLRFHVVTLFPNVCEPYLSDSILARAIKEKKIAVSFYNPRDYVKGKHRKVWPDGNVSKIVDDRPYGGGPGMVIRAEPVLDCVDVILKKIEKRKPTKTDSGKPKIKIILLGPHGAMFNTAYAKTTTKKYTDIILLSGRYEGIDVRVKNILKAEEVSIGDYVLTGGELPALVMIDSMARQVEGVLGNFDSREEERVSSNEFYTRPEVIEYKKKKYKVPEVFISGHHKKIEKRKKEGKEKK